MCIRDSAYPSSDLAIMPEDAIAAILEFASGRDLAAIQAAGSKAIHRLVDDGARRPRRADNAGGADNAGALYPSLGDDESYKLRITATSATLKARTVWGALRGLETFSQLVTYDFDAATYQVLPCTIQDAPRYPHRGLMVDSGRHFLPVATLLHVVDALPYAKLNVLHWHLTDTQSFPVEAPSRRAAERRAAAGTVM